MQNPFKINCFLPVAGSEPKFKLKWIIFRPWPDRSWFGEEKKQFSFEIPFKINRLTSAAGSETAGRRQKIRFSILELIVFCPWLDRSRLGDEKNILNSNYIQKWKILCPWPNRSVSGLFSKRFRNKFGFQECILMKTYNVFNENLQCFQSVSDRFRIVVDSFFIPFLFVFEYFSKHFWTCFKSLLFSNRFRIVFGTFSGCFGLFSVRFGPLSPRFFCFFGVVVVVSTSFSSSWLPSSSLSSSSPRQRRRRRRRRRILF